jgi:microcystin-dependent protein
MIGDYKFTSRNSDGHGWLICDGRTVNRSQYPALFDIIGTSFGAPSGSTFKIPDFRGRVSGAIGQGS